MMTDDDATMSAPRVWTAGDQAQSDAFTARVLALVRDQAPDPFAMVHGLIQTAGALIEGILNRDGLRAAEAGWAGAQANAEAILGQIAGMRTDTSLEPDGEIIHPTNWKTLQLLKDTANNYMGRVPF